MEANRFLGPTCVIKVNTIKCCKACPGKLRKKLQKSHGVSSILVDQEKDLAIVSGNIDPTQLVEAIKRIVKKNAEVLFYEKDTSLVQQKLQQLFNKISGPHHEDSDIVVDDIDEDNKDRNDEESSCEFSHDNTIHKLKRGHGSRSHFHQQHYNVDGKGSDQSTISRGRHVFANPSAATARGYGHASAGLPPARLPYAYGGYDRCPTVMYAGGLPGPPPWPTLLPAFHDRYRQTNLPPPEAALIMMQPAYNPCFKRRDPPTSTSIFHYFSDDNSDACIIV